MTTHHTSRDQQQQHKSSSLKRTFSPESVNNDGGGGVGGGAILGGGKEDKCVKIEMEDGDVIKRGKVGSSQEDGAGGAVGGQMHPHTATNAFLDAHIIFEPLLSSLGLMPQQITNLSLKNLGSQVLITAEYFPNLILIF